MDKVVKDIWVMPQWLGRNPKVKKRKKKVLLLDRKALIVAINNNSIITGRPKVFKNSHREKKAGLRNEDESESVAAVLCMCTEQEKTKGFRKINRT